MTAEPVTADAASKAPRRPVRATSSVARASAGAEHDGRVALVLHARALRHERFAPAAGAVLNSLVQLLGCERVSLGLHLQGRLQVVADSAGADASVRRNYLDMLTAAMQEAVDQRATIVYPVPLFGAPLLHFAHAELSRASGGLAVLSVPIVGGDRVLGAFLFERHGAFDELALKAAHDAALFVGPVLELKHRLAAPVAGRLMEALAPRGVQLGERALSPWRLGCAIASIALAIAALWPVTFNVVAPARVEGIDQRILTAPVDGFIASVAARPGVDVTRGQLLASLEDRDLLLQSQKLAAEITQYDKQYREALAGDDAGQIVLARAVVEQARAQRELVESELERTRLRAPFDGALIDGDLSAMLGAPVTRGQPLLTVSPVKGYKVVAEVDDEDITLLRTGQQAQVLFAGLGQAPVAFDVQRISPVAVTLDGRNVFEVEGRVTETTTDMPAEVLRPGQRGIARIAVDERLQVRVWSLRVGHWLRRMLWQFMA